jgi:hypothetical protein
MNDTFVLERVSVFLETDQVARLACCSRLTATLNSDLHWASRGKQVGWIEQTLRVYFRFTSWRLCCYAAAVYRGLCATALSLGLTVPRIPPHSPHAVRVAAIDSTVEALHKYVCSSDGILPADWSAVLHLTAFYLLALRQISVFRCSGASASHRRSRAVMLAEVPVLMWAALLFFNDALPVNERGFSRRWISGNPLLICRTLALFRIIARPAVRNCLELLRHTHPATQDPVRDAASLLLMHVVASSDVISTSVPFIPGQIAAACVSAESPPARLPFDAMEQTVRAALKDQCSEFVGDGFWEGIERTVLISSKPSSVNPAGSADTVQSLTAKAWTLWQAGLSSIPYDQAEACALSVFLALPADVMTPKAIRAPYLLEPPRTLGSGSEPAAVAKIDGDYVAGGSGYVPFSSSSPPRVWRAQRAFTPNDGAVTRQSASWQIWAVRAARRVAAGLFFAVSAADLVVFAAPDALTPCRDFYEGLACYEKK